MVYRKTSERKTSALAVALGLIFILLSVFFLSGKDFGLSSSGFDTSQDFVRVLDVGQADCTLIYSNGYSALIDVGTEDAGNDICIALKDCGIKEIDVMLITHLHADHSGGAEKISELFEIKNVILPEISTDSEGLASAELVINKVTKSGGGVYTAQSGMNFNIGEFEITVLAAFDQMTDENNRSIMTMARIGDLKFMFTGDAESEAEKALLSENLDLNCDVFKAGHHGSSTSNTEELLAEMKPRYVAISAGEGNMYGHPNNETLAAFERIGAEVFRTDYDGDITFYVKDGKIALKTEK